MEEVAGCPQVPASSDVVLTGKVVTLNVETVRFSTQPNSHDICSHSLHSGQSFVVIILFISGGAESSSPPRLFSSCSKRRLRFLPCTAFLLRWLLLMGNVVSRSLGLQQLWLRGSRAPALWLWSLIVPWHVGSSWTRDRIRVSCIGR